MTEAEHFERDVERFVECLEFKEFGKVGGLVRASELYGIHPANGHPSELAAYKEALQRIEAKK